MPHLHQPAHLSLLPRQHHRLQHLAVLGEDHLELGCVVHRLLPVLGLPFDLELDRASSSGWSWSLLLICRCCSGPPLLFFLLDLPPHCLLLLLQPPPPLSPEPLNLLRQPRLLRLVAPGLVDLLLLLPGRLALPRLKVVLQLPPLGIELPVPHLGRLLSLQDVVVCLLGVCVCQHLVGVRQEVELLGRPRVVRVLVRVAFQRLLPVRLLDGLVVGVDLDLQQLVQVHALDALHHLASHGGRSAITLLSLY